MFADGRNGVRFSAVAPSDLSGLNTAIQAVLGVDGKGADGDAAPDEAKADADAKTETKADEAPAKG